MRVYVDPVGLVRCGMGQIAVSHLYGLLRSRYHLVPAPSGVLDDAVRIERQHRGL